MDEPVDLTQPVLFYDDRNKHDIDYRLHEILFQNDHLCLCVIVPIVRPESYLAADIEKAKQPVDSANDAVNTWWHRIDRETVLFDYKTSEVLTENLSRWYATNDTTIHGRYEDASQSPELNVERVVTA